MRKLKKLVASASKKLKRSAPTILSVASVIGVGGSVVLTGVATPKALALIEENSREKHDGDPYAYTKVEAFLSCWKCYIPTAVVTLSTMGCILAANALNKKQQAALVAACLTLNESYKEYRKKANELYGPDTEYKIKKAISKDKAVQQLEQEDDDLDLFYFEYAPNDGYFRSTKEDVITAMYYLNRIFHLNGEVYINEFLDFLNLDGTESGNVFGWALGDAFQGYEWIEFSLENVILDDGLEYTIIHCPFYPTVL